MTMARDVHIAAARAAMRRTERRMDELEAPFSFPAHCCPGCACGPEWKELHDKLGRQAEQLACMLENRGRPGDNREARMLRFDYVGSDA